MAIDRVTITGADDSIRPEQLIPLSREFPFVEWGVLVSKRAADAGGSPRYPTRDWIADVQLLAANESLNLSLHVCGRWVRDLLVGKVSLPTDLLARFQRVQLNFHAENAKCDPEEFVAALRHISGANEGRSCEFIFQIDGSNGNAHLDSAFEWEAEHCYALFDISGGAGILPDKWPEPIYMRDETYLDYHGYAGGLGPDNLKDQIPKILRAAGRLCPRIWIDMETRVRSEDDRQFDLAKVRRCLEIAAPFVKASATLETP